MAQPADARGLSSSTICSAFTTVSFIDGILGLAANARENSVARQLPDKGVSLVNDTASSRMDGLDSPGLEARARQHGQIK